MSTTQITKGRNPISSGLAIESFRRMGFKITSAICEIVDNSIEAEATNIRIIIEFKKLTGYQKNRRIEKFVFIDNGYGMDKDVLFDCLVLGEGTKRGLKRGIGRFGVGATFAGISQGKFIGVFSKTKTGKWNYTQLDLNLLNQGEGIPEPVEMNPPTEYSNELDGQGTIIIWDNIDSTETEKDLPNTIHNIGRVYRKFLTEKIIKDGKLVENKPIILTINRENVPPYDPLYVTYSPKPDDRELATIESSEEFDFRPLEGKMRITISHLPQSWYDDPTVYKPGSDPINKIERKMSPDVMGISIIREGREMAFGEIAFLKLLPDTKEDSEGSYFLPPDRFTGIEISFDRDSDDRFGIEANKSKMFLPRETRDKIGKILYPILKQRRLDFSSVRGKKEEKEKHPGVNKSKKIIQNNMPSPHYTDEEKERIRKFAEKMGNTKIEIDEFYNDLVSGYLPMHSWELDPSGPFVQYEHQLKSIIVKYNMNHPFMKKFFETLEDIALRKGVKKEDALTVEEIQRTKTLFDLLLASYGLAEISFQNPNHQEEVGNTLNTLKRNWGDIAHRITKKDIKSE